MRLSDEQAKTYKELLSQRQKAKEKWDRRFLELAKQVASWSKDPSTKVGAVLVNDQKHVVGMGFNGFARGIADTDERLNDRELKYKLVVHAEMNAILQAGPRAAGTTIYVYPAFSFPPICENCCKHAIQAGVKEIVGYTPDMNDPRVQRWLASIEIAKMMWLEAGLTWREIQE